MKNTLLRMSILAAASMATSLSGQGYIKASLGYSDLKATNDTDDTTSRAEIGFGYQIGNWFSLETSYFETGSFDVQHPIILERLPPPGRDYLYAPLSIDGFNLTTRLRLNVTDEWQVFTRQGFSYYNLEHSQPSFPPAGLEDNTTRYVPTLGISYTSKNFDHLVVELEISHESLTAFDDFATDISINTLKMGISWKL